MQDTKLQKQLFFKHNRRLPAPKIGASSSSSHFRRKSSPIFNYSVKNSTKPLNNHPTCLPCASAGGFISVILKKSDGGFGCFQRTDRLRRLLHGAADPRPRYLLQQLPRYDFPSRNDAVCLVKLIASFTLRFIELGLQFLQFLENRFQFHCFSLTICAKKLIIKGLIFKLGKLVIR